MRDLIIVGGGEIARVIIDTAQSSTHWNILGFVDPEQCNETVERMGIRRLGDDTALTDYPGAMCVLGVGALKVSTIRERIVEGLNIPAARWATIIHPTASVSQSAKLAHGVVVLPGAVICTGATIAEHCIVNLGAKIDHDVHVGKFVFVAPQVALGGGCRVEDYSYIGMGAMIRDHVTVSNHTLVGMGAVVSKQFSPGATLVGVPAKPLDRLAA